MSETSPQRDEGFYQGLIDTMSDGVYFVDRERTITYWSRGAERLTGFTAQEVVGRRCRDGILNHCDDAGTVLCGGRCPLKDTMIDGKPREARVWMHHRDGHRQPVWVRGAPLRGPDGMITGAVETFSDDRAVRAIREELADSERLALTDPLTGIGNRRYLLMQLVSRLDEFHRHGWPFAVLYADIDHFKKVNDTFGHDVGDDVLRMVARTLTYGSRASDTVARIGGEEFAVVVPRADGAELATSAERLRALVARSGLYADRRHVEVTISLGGTLVVPGDTAELLLRRADARLYQAKRAGRDRVNVDPATESDAGPGRIRPSDSAQAWAST